MSWTLEFAPLLPLPMLAAVAAIGIVIAAVLMWRGTRGAGLRVACLALLLLALANPSLRQEDRESLSNIAVVAIDESASQRISGRTAMTHKVRDALRDRLAALPNLEVRWVTSPRSEGAERDGTTLFADLQDALADVPPDRLAGIIMVTDGLIHDVPARAEDLGIKVPVHAFITGDRGEVDRRIEIVRAPRYGLVGGTQRAAIRVLDAPEPAPGTSVEITIKGENQTVETRRIPVGQTVEVPITFSHAGTNIVELEVEPLAGELTRANNKAVLAAEGVREHLRVLLVSGEPHAGERVWRNLLKSDAAVDLVHFTILRPPEKQDGTPINQLSLIAFPTRELFSEKLDEFDLIIFDRYHRRGVLPLLYLDNVARYVENGGAVLVAAGEHYATATSLYRTPLSSILPAVPTGRVIEQPFRPELTDLGRKHPVTRGLDAGEPMPWGRWFRVVDAAAEGDVVMQGPEQKPLLVLDRRGEGRVALLLSDHAWLWSRGFEGGGPYTTLLRRLAHWLMKEPDLEEEMLKATGRGQTLIIERRTIQDQVEPVEVTAPSGEVTSVVLDQVAPGLWEKRLAAAEQGVYRVKSGELAAVANMGTVNVKEFTRLTADDALLQPVLEQTSGGAFWVGREAEALGSLPRIALLRSERQMHGQDWLALRQRDAYVTRGVTLIPLFAGALALALLLAAISLTWFREGR